MPSAPPRLCHVTGHPPFIGKGCPLCAAAYRKPTHNAFYHSGAWRRIADTYRASRAGICEECGAPHASHVDHKVPRARGGSDEPSNLQLLCTACHGRKSAREGSRWSARG